MSDGLATHRYKAVEIKPGKWKVFEHGRPVIKDGWTDERSAKHYALLWNYWNGPYAPGEEARCKPLTLEIAMQMTAIDLHGATFDLEEDDDRIAPDEEATAGESLPVQQSLW